MGKYTFVLLESTCNDSLNEKFGVNTPSGSQPLVSVENAAIQMATITRFDKFTEKEEVLQLWILVKSKETDAVLSVVMTCP